MLIKFQKFLNQLSLEELSRSHEYLSQGTFIKTFEDKLKPFVPVKITKEFFAKIISLKSEKGERYNTLSYSGVLHQGTKGNEICGVTVTIDLDRKEYIVTVDKIKERVSFDKNVLEEIDSLVMASKANIKQFQARFGKDVHSQNGEYYLNIADSFGFKLYANPNNVLPKQLKIGFALKSDKKTAIKIESPESRYYCATYSWTKPYDNTEFGPAEMLIDLEDKTFQPLKPAYQGKCIIIDSRKYNVGGTYKLTDSEYNTVKKMLLKS